MAASSPIALPVVLLKNSDLDRALALFNEMCVENVTPGVLSYNVLIVGVFKKKASS